MDIIGLSGLITPSLEEMAFVASEMEREGFTIPLLIGGATTSRVHTAVKIEPHYHGPTVHVLDASRAVGVAGNLLSDTLRDGFVADVREEYRDVREQRSRTGAEERRQPLADARRNRLAIDWSGVTPPVPCSTGLTVLDDYPLDELVARIDWTPFFQTWELSGHYPAILDDPTVGAAASGLFRDAQALLDRIVRERLLRARGVLGFFRGQRRGRRHRALRRRGADRAARGHPHPAAADAQAAGTAQPRARRLRGAARRRASPTTSAPSR